MHALARNTSRDVARMARRIPIRIHLRIQFESMIFFLLNSLDFSHQTGLTFKDSRNSGIQNWFACSLARKHRVDM